MNNGELKVNILLRPIADSLSSLFTACLRHGYMPKGIRDCIRIPVPKNNKDE